MTKLHAEVNRHVTPAGWPAPGGARSFNQRHEELTATLLGGHYDCEKVVWKMSGNKQ